MLKTIYSNDPISRAEVARVTNLTPPTVSDVVANLISSGFVEEVGLAPSSSGRRAILLRFVDDSRQLDVNRIQVFWSRCDLKEIF